MSGLRVRPLTIKDANQAVRDWHQHHKPVAFAWFAVGVERDGELIGAAIIGRPNARAHDDGYTAEVSRVAVNREADNRNACSMLYGAARRAAAALGYRRLVTYTLATEEGASLRAAGMRRAVETPARSWAEDRGTGTPSLLRLMTGEADSGPTMGKVRWEWP